MGFFWNSLAPYSLLALFGVALVTTAFVVWSADVQPRTVLLLGGLVLGAGIALVLPTQFLVVRSRLERPIVRLEHELRGKLPWRPEGDALLGSLRRAVQAVRDNACEATGDLARERRRVQELQHRVDEQAAADRFGARVAEVLRGADHMGRFAAESAKLVREVWPAEHVLLLLRDDEGSDLELLHHDAGGESMPVDDETGEVPRYRKASLPSPIKEALRRGFYAETGLPFSQDPAFPAARSFVCLALEHRGPGAGILLAASTALVTPSVEPLRRARPLFSIGFSRSLYLREMEEAAVRDALTGTYTYDHFQSVARHEVARSNRYSRPLACLIVDIDGLKRLNDTHGAHTGDRVIAEVAQVIQGAVRSSDILARISGGRFALLLPETVEEASTVVAERVLVRVEEHPFIVHRGVVERATVSVGIAVHPPHGVTALTLLDAAHEALREAKVGGRNRYALIDGTSPAGHPGVLLTGE